VRRTSVSCVRCADLHACSEASQRPPAPGAGRSGSAGTAHRGRPAPGATSRHVPTTSNDRRDRRPPETRAACAGWVRHGPLAQCRPRTGQKACVAEVPSPPAQPQQPASTRSSAPSAQVPAPPTHAHTRHSAAAPISCACPHKVSQLRPPMARKIRRVKGESTWLRAPREQPACESLARDISQRPRVRAWGLIVRGRVIVGCVSQEGASWAHGASTWRPLTSAPPPRAGRAAPAFAGTAPSRSSRR